MVVVLAVAVKTTNKICHKYKFYIPKIYTKFYLLLSSSSNIVFTYEINAFTFPKIPAISIPSRRLSTMPIILFYIIWKRDFRLSITLLPLCTHLHQISKHKINRIIIMECQCKLSFRILFNVFRITQTFYKTICNNNYHLNARYFTHPYSLTLCIWYIVCQHVARYRTI